ncbi:sugar ABC transporter permease [Clostridium sp. 19966]|uniref:carbohydrate ABC transporter permease n=1 Tax=Clostridium sp. 19966 TaxID=2768166 RepID=UPI0028DF853B|nr:sugar ABC transporter permease [Clostridium sp. 19966]MDT8715523.1 sugar ABC transporter permease [Clostridium sp. 19966]
MKLKNKVNKNNYAYLFIAPYFIAFMIFGLYPILYTFYLSLTDWDGTASTPKFILFDNFKTLIRDTTFFSSIGNTAIMWIANIIPQMIFALFLAVALTNTKIKGKEFFRGIFFLPNLVTVASVAVLFRFIMDWQTGALNRILMSLKILNQPVEWLQSITATRGGVSFINWWMWFGYTMIIIIAGIKAIPDDVLEAAIVDGANKWQSFWNITLPLIRPTMLYTVITSLIGGMTMFDVPFLLTNGDGSPQGSILTMVMYQYNTAFRTYNFGYGATIGTGLFILLAVVVFIAYKMMNRKPVYD